VLRAILIRMGGEIGNDRIKVLVFLANLAAASLGNFAFHEGFRHTMTAWITAGAAVGVRQHLFDFGDAGIFFHMEEFRSPGHKDAEDKA